jgi:hypothetical protein
MARKKNNPMRESVLRGMDTPQRLFVYSSILNVFEKMEKIEESLHPTLRFYGFVLFGNREIEEFEEIQQIGLYNRFIKSFEKLIADGLSKQPALDTLRLWKCVNRFECKIKKFTGVTPEGFRSRLSESIQKYNRRMRTLLINQKIEEQFNNNKATGTRRENLLTFFSEIIQGNTPDIIFHPQAIEFLVKKFSANISYAHDLKELSKRIAVEILQDEELFEEWKEYFREEVVLHLKKHDRYAASRIEEILA